MLRTHTWTNFYLSRSRIPLHSSFIYHGAREFLSFYPGSHYLNELNYYACYVNCKYVLRFKIQTGQEYFKNFF